MNIWGTPRQKPAKGNSREETMPLGKEGKRIIGVQIY